MKRNIKEAEYTVYGMSCAACSARVERAVKPLHSVDECEVNLLLGTLTVRGDASAEEVMAAVRSAGYGIAPASDGADYDEYEAQGAARMSALMRRLIASGAILLVLMYVTMGHVMWGWWLPHFLSQNPPIIAIIEFILSSAVLLINRAFFISGTKAIIKRSPNMDSLVAIGSATSFIFSICLSVPLFIEFASGNIAESARHLHGLYFESAAMIPALITLGKMLEESAKGKTTSALRALMDLAPKFACVLRGGEELTVRADEIEVGDIVLVRSAEGVCHDGIIIEGEGAFDESALSGESIPREHTAGDKVYAGTTLVSGFVKLRVTDVGSDTALGEIINAVRAAAVSRAPVSKTADRVAGIFVPVVMIIAIAAAAAWMFLGQSIGFALARGVSVLVISCPCALGLATPVSIMVASGVGARCHILFKNAAAIESAGRVNTVCLDKTGTITEGEPGISDIIAISAESEELLALAAAVEYESSHPLGRAIVRAYNGPRYESEDFRPELFGVSARVLFGAEKIRIYGGSLRFIGGIINADITDELKAAISNLADAGKTPLIFATEEHVLGVIALSDKVRADSGEAIAELHRMGIRTVMLSGDSRRCAEAVAKEVGIDDLVAEVLPEDKERHVAALRESGSMVAMIGDGINDAPALVKADLGIAIGAGTNIAIDSADIVLKRSSLADAVQVIRLGRRTLRIIHQNLFWAFIYNIVGIPLAAGVFIPLGLTLEPMFGAMAMSLSSFIVVMNALRINLFKPKNVKQYTAESCNAECMLQAEITEEKEEINKMKYVFKIEGMMCPHCEGRVRSLIEAIEGTADVGVSHGEGTARFSAGADFNTEALKGAIESQGYRVLGIERS